MESIRQVFISLGIQPTRADRCTFVCYDGAFKNDDVSSGTKTPSKSRTTWARHQAR